MNMHEEVLLSDVKLLKSSLSLPLKRSSKRDQNFHPMELSSKFSYLYKRWIVNILQQPFGMKGRSSGGDFLFLMIITIIIIIIIITIVIITAIIITIATFWLLGILNTL